MDSEGEEDLLRIRDNQYLLKIGNGYINTDLVVRRIWFSSIITEATHFNIPLETFSAHFNYSVNFVETINYQRQHHIDMRGAYIR